MNNQQEEKNKTLRELLRQHWLHCRHIETERAWFMNVFAIVTGGIIAYAFKDSKIELWPIYFLIAFTVIGLLLNIRWKQAFNHHRDKVKATVRKLGIRGIVWVPPAKCKILSTGYFFIYFYAIILIGLIILVTLAATEVI
jgi:hypothetical protein